jgi:hypothetical protein
LDFVTVPISATPGADYQAIRGTLTFAPGETSKTIRIPLLDDGLAELQEEFTLLLTNAVGFPIHGPASMNVQIADDERGYRIVGSEGPYGALTVSEADDEVSVRIVREGDFNVLSSVDYHVSQARPAGQAQNGNSRRRLCGCVWHGRFWTGRDGERDQAATSQRPCHRTG